MALHLDTPTLMEVLERFASFQGEMGFQSREGAARQSSSILTESERREKGEQKEQWKRKELDGNELIKRYSDVHQLGHNMNSDI